MASLVNENLEIPTIPEVASEALRLMNDPDVTGAQLARTISQDQGLTAKVLKVANSALYALPREVNNLQQAAMILGFTTLKTIVVSASCRSIYRRFGMVERALWTHSVATAMATHTIARKLDLKHRDEAFVAGLMHDVGKVVMNNGDRERYRSALKLSREENISSIEAEVKIFGFSHVDVGSILVQRWGLPPALEHAVFLHHDPDLAVSVAEEYLDLVYATHTADRVAHFLGLAPPYSTATDTLSADEAADALGLDEAHLTALADEIKLLYEKDHSSFS
ncbi:MAG: HDOD domain-containing protein [Myxococcota bacterium]